MEYVYAALLLHKLKQNITEDSVKNVVKAAGVTPDDVRVKALVAALSEVQIDEVLKAAPEFSNGERRRFERRHHLSPREEVQVAAVHLGAFVLRVLLRQRGEIAAAAECGGAVDNEQLLDAMAGERLAQPWHEKAIHNRDDER